MAHTVIREVQDTTRFSIVGGPPLDAMLDSLKEGDPNWRKDVIFKVYRSNPNFVTNVVMKIEKLEREDGSGKRWIFGGWTFNNIRIEGFYDCERRTGYLDRANS